MIPDHALAGVVHSRIIILSPCVRHQKRATLGFYGGIFVMAVEGFWTVQFQGRNGAVVVLTKGKIFGGIVDIRSQVPMKVIRASRRES